MKQIELTQGKYALVDERDFETVNQHRWHATKRPKGNFYAQRTLRGVRRNGKRIIQQMPQFILNTDRPVDHRDGNGLNNQRDNLRICTPLENSRNRPANVKNKSGFKGVYPTVGTISNWSAAIYENGKQIYLGSFSTPEKAAVAYDEMASSLFGQFARLNFPRNGNHVSARKK